jgi:hypothetical protein
MANSSRTIAVVACLATLAAAQIQPVVTDGPGKGAVDWSERTIVAVGIAAPNPNLPQAAARPSAERAATIIALRNALETVKGMYLTSSTTVQNFMTTSDVITTRVSGFVKGFEKKGRTKYMSDGTVEITLEIPLDGIGGLGEALLGERLSQEPRKDSFEGKKAKSPQVFTGLIVDCSGLKVKPAMSPKILDKAGKEVYGSAYVSREWAVKYGIVGYAKAVADAAELERVGDKPGQVKALKAAGDNKTDVVIGDDDAAAIRSAAENLKFLSECRVVLVID